MAERSRNSVGYMVLAAIIVLGSCFRIFICFHFNPVDFIFSDPSRHWMNGVYFRKVGYAGASDPIGYQFFIFVVRKLSFGNRYLVALSSALLSVLMPWTYYRAARSFGLQKMPALWVWALIAWAPSLLAIYHYIMMETLLLFLDGLALWATARYLRKSGTYPFLLMVFLWSAAVLTKPTVAPLAAVCGIWCWWKRRTPLKTIAIAVTMVVVMLIPQSMRSYSALGFVAPFGNLWLTKIQYRANTNLLELKFYPDRNQFRHFQGDRMYDIVFNSPSCSVMPFAPFSDWQIERGRASMKAAISVRSAYGDQDWKNAFRYFEPDRRLGLRLWGENIVLFLFAPSWPESEARGWIDQWELPSRWIWAPIVFVVLIGNLRLFLKRRFELVPVAVTCLTLVLALQNQVIMEGRYRKPLEPLLLLNLVWIIASWSRTSPLGDIEAAVSPRRTADPAFSPIARRCTSLIAAVHSILQIPFCIRSSTASTISRGSQRRRSPSRGSPIPVTMTGTS